MLARPHGGDRLRHGGIIAALTVAFAQRACLYDRVMNHASRS
jgi:hypothetical protein